MLRAGCREYGLRITPQRTAVYEELCRSGTHPTAEELHAGVRRRFANISLDTVNRTLLTFARIGLIEIIEGYGGPRRYDPNRTLHHHLHCLRCGTVVDFYHEEYDTLAVPAHLKHKFKVLSKKVILQGTCGPCQGIKKKHYDRK